MGNFVFIHRKVVGLDLYEATALVTKTQNSEKFIVAGYRCLIKLKLMLDIPMSCDIVREAEL